ncbi:O-antigen polysaccharide polymerase Wzy [Cupriavidus sp. SK-4]|uniref:O-antigen polysaccharide polymerase Wzy n=1 Tax=Cupriavidus sp. SK-4 TaxID=574750 RepID=UPI000A05A501|nr:O-antigen polysaccharide polymerase Wzy [Cupriavidus sp. SK-4]
MPNFLFLATVALVIANLISGAYGVLAWQEPITALTFFVCIYRVSKASSSRFNPAMLLCLTTTLFLLSRFLITYFFGWSDYRYGDWFRMGPMNDHTVALSLCGISLFLCGIALSAGKLGNVPVRNDQSLGAFALRSGLALLPFALYRVYINIDTWRNGDYLALYKYGGPSGIPYALGGWLIFCVFMYLASRPKQRSAFMAYGFGLVLCVLDMLKGARGIPMAQIIALTWLLVMTQELKVSWWKAACAGIGLAIVADIVGRVRVGIPVATAISSDPFETLFGFAYGQGVSLIFIESTATHLVRFTPVDGLRATFATFLDGYHRMLGDLAAGQTLEFVKHTASLAHRISFIVDPKMYLEGKGMGGSAVAESLLYSRLFGPLVAGLFTGMCLRLLHRVARASPLGLFVFAATLPFFLLLPRENQLLFVVPMLKASLFATIFYVIAKFHVRQPA